MCFYLYKKWRKKQEHRTCTEKQEMAEHQWFPPDFVGFRLCRRSVWNIPQALMWMVVVVVANIAFGNVSQLGFSKNDEMIQTFLP
jgi:hypothetical protein